MIGIYKFTNKLTGESYIGQSRDIHKRYIQHKCRHEICLHEDTPKEDTYFHSMLRYYGFNNFDFEVIEECCIDELNDKEIYYIKTFGTLFPNGYNIDRGGNLPHPNKFDSYETVEEVIELLKTSTKSNIEIGEIYGVSDQTISDINNGKTWRKDGLSYPIRQTRKLINFRKTNNLEKITYYCSKCGKELSGKCKTGLCVNCCRKMQENNSTIPPKETLYELLLSQPFTKVAQMYNVSDNAVRKWCDKYNIPRHSSYYRNVA